MAAGDKKTTIPVKNIKAKALGQTGNQNTMISSYKARIKNTEEKENEGEFLKKGAHNLDKKLFLHDTQSRRNRDLTEPSLANFSCMLVPKEGD